MVGGDQGGEGWCQEGPEGVRADGMFTRGPRSSQSGRAESKEGPGGMDGGAYTVGGQGGSGCGMKTPELYLSDAGRGRGGGLRTDLKVRLEAARG